MTDKQFQKKSRTLAVKKAYAPNNCPKNRNKGKCTKCDRIVKCDKDFSLRFSDLRLQAIGEAGQELKKKGDKITSISEKAPKEPPAPAAPESAAVPFEANPGTLAETRTTLQDNGGPVSLPPEPEPAPRGEEKPIPVTEAASAAQEAPEPAPAPEPLPEIVEAAPEAAPEVIPAPEKRLVSPLKFWR